MAFGVEDPVALVRHDRVDGGDLAVGVEADLRVDYVGVGCGCGVELGVGCAGDGVVGGVVEGDGEGLGEDARGDV